MTYEIGFILIVSVVVILCIQILYSLHEVKLKKKCISTNEPISKVEPVQAVACPPPATMSPRIYLEPRIEQTKSSSLNNSKKKDDDDDDDEDFDDLDDEDFDDDDDDDDDDDGSFLKSAAIGYMTDSTISGGLIGGSFLGAAVGDALNDD